MIGHAAAAALQADFSAIKQDQQGAWASGDYSVVGTTLQIVGESLCEALDLRAGSRVLDVAAGNGNATLAAARRFCDVVSSDYVPALLAKGRKRAAAELLAVAFRVADAEDLPFDRGEFDVTLSVFGAMFALDHAQTARELVRVTRPRGLIGLANWTPDSFVGEMFRLIGKYAPSPAALKAPTLWGSEDYLRSLFGSSIRGLRATRRQFNFRYLSAEHFVTVFRSYYGPVHKAFLRIPAAEQELLAEELRELAARSSRASDRLIVPSDYLEVVITV